MSRDQAHTRILIGDWTVEPDMGRMCRDGAVTEIEPRILDLLIFFAEHAGQTVSTDQLAASVWKGRAISDQPIYQCVAQLRKVLGDDAHEPRYLATIRKRGYKLIASVSWQDQIQAVQSPRQQQGRRVAAMLSPILIVSYLLFGASDVSTPPNDSPGWTENAAAADLYYRGLHHMGKRRAESLALAIELLEQAIAEDPTFAKAYAALADAYFLASDERYGTVPAEIAAQNFREVLEKAESLNQDLAQVQLLLGEIDVDNGDFESAEQRYLKALKLDPGHVNAHLQYSFLLTYMGRHEESLQARQRAVQLEPANTVARLNLAVGHANLQQIDAAIAETGIAIELEPDWHVPYQKMAQLVAQTGQIAEAIRYGKKAYAIEPAGRLVPAAALGVGFRYLTLGEFEEAMHWLDLAEKAGASDWSVSHQRVKLMLARDHYGAVNNALQHWAVESPDPASASLYAGLYRAVMGQDDEAREALELAARLASNGDRSPLLRFNPFSWGYLPAVHLARLYRQSGRDADAKRLLRESRSVLDLADIRGPGWLYANASYHAAAGDEDATFSALRKAIDAGWAQLWLLERDPVFADFRNAVAYQEIVGILEQNLDAEREKLASPGADSGSSRP